MSDAGKFNISFSGPMHDNTFAIGDYHTIVQHHGLSPTEAAELANVFESLRSDVAGTVAPDQRDEALEQVAELERAVVAAQPDPGRVKRVLGWFRANAPAAAGAVLSVVVHPLVGKIVEHAGTAIGEQFGEAVKDVSA